jgi:hypothetical protein
VAGRALADDLARVLDAEPLGLSCAELARRTRRRLADVLAALRGDPRFQHDGRGRGSRWRLAVAREGVWEGRGRKDRPGLTVRITLADQREYMRRGTP